MTTVVLHVESPDQLAELAALPACKQFEGVTLVAKGSALDCWLSLTERFGCDHLNSPEFEKQVREAKRRAYLRERSAELARAAARHAPLNAPPEAGDMLADVNDDDEEELEPTTLDVAAHPEDGSWPAS